MAPFFGQLLILSWETSTQLNLQKLFSRLCSCCARVHIVSHKSTSLVWTCWYPDQGNDIGLCVFVHSPHFPVVVASPAQLFLVCLGVSIRESQPLKLGSEPSSSHGSCEECHRPWMPWLLHMEGWAACGVHQEQVLFNLIPRDCSEGCLSRRAYHWTW